MSLQNVSVVPKKPGAVLIINCCNFDEVLKLNKREASVYDVQRLKIVFTIMNFEVQILNDPSLDGIHKKIRELSQINYTHLASLVIIFMTHGDKDDILFCKDGKYQFKDLLMKLFQNENRSLKDIPKYIIVEACKGNFDPNITAYDSKYPQFQYIPNLIGVLTSSFEGFLSFMHKDGSPFIKKLCEVLTEYCQTKDTEDISFWNVLCKIATKFEFDDQQTPMMDRLTMNDEFKLGEHL